MFGGFNNNPFGLNSHFMMDPFGVQQPQQQQQRNSRNRQMDPFGGDMLMSPFQQHNQHMQQQMMSNPFAMMQQMMGGGGHFNPQMQMQQHQQHGGNVLHASPDSQVFSSSSMVSYSNAGADGRPKIFQQSTQTRQGPGGVKETREMLRDSERGIEKVSVGHHIGDRAHVIERQKVKGQDIEEIVNLENLDDDEVNQFNHEFESKIRQGHHNHSHHGQTHLRAHAHSINNTAPFAIEDGSASSSSGRSSKNRGERKSKASKQPPKRTD